MPTVSITARVSPELHRQVEKAANREHVSVGEIMRRALAATTGNDQR